MTAALAVSVFVVDTADAQFRLFGRGRGRDRGASWSGGSSYSPGGYYGGGYYDNSYNTGWVHGMPYTTSGSAYTYPQGSWSNSYPSTTWPSTPTYSSSSFYTPTTGYATGGSVPCASPYPIYSPYESRTTQGTGPTTSQSFYTPRPMEARNNNNVEAVPIGEKSHDGTVVKVGTNTLTMRSGTTNEEHTHFVPADAKVTRDGSSAKLEDLRKDDFVVVTTKTNPEMTVLKVDARPKR
jgi:hypothetical protein